jgi:T5SS/PEP-CTERM-associated repeat protein
VKRKSSLILPALFFVGSVPALAVDYTSTGSGIWHPTNPDNIWSPVGNPLPGASDNMIINGHTVIFGNTIGSATAGLSGSGDLGVSNGNRIDINNGGVLSQEQTGWWVRIGHSGLGTLNINDGRFHFTNGTGGGSNLQVGVQDANSEGRINVGDGTGGAGTAVLNLRHRINGDDQGGTVNMNLGASNNTFGIVTVNSDGLLQGDAIVRGANAQNPHIRVGQQTSTFQSILRVNGGGQANVRGNLEVGAGAGAQGLVHLTGANARMDQYDGDFTVGFNGTGGMLIENNAVYLRHDNPDARMDGFVGRGAGTGTITVRDGGQFIRAAGGNVGDFRIGLGGTGILNIGDGGLFLNQSNNWDWVGQDSGGNGTVTINQGGIYRSTGSSNLNVGVNGGATGLLHVNGGFLDLQSGTHAEIRVGQNGNGTFRQSSGTSNVRAVILAENSGTATFEMQGGTFTTRGGFLMGGANTGSTGNGSATVTQSGGTMNVGGALVVGLATNHAGIFNLTGGTLNHTASDTSIGESGTGTMTIGSGATFSDTSAGSFYVGRNDGSSGTLWVDGTLSRTAATAIRVGNGNGSGVNNTNAPGTLGGTGTINATAGGVTIGTRGTLTAGTLASVGTLTINGNVDFSTGGQLFMNLGAGGASDRIQLNGTLNIEGALLALSTNSASIAPGSYHWLVVNDGTDSITGSFANLSATSAHSAWFPPADGWITVEGQEFGVFYGGDFATQSLTGGNDLVLAAIPEPGSLALIGFATGLCLLRRRRPSA